MQTLITGDSGFVGGHLKRALPSYVSLGNVDITDPSALNDFCKRHTFDQVVHLAAQSFIPFSFENPKETFDINFMGTFNLLNALKKRGFKGRFLYVSSADVYGKQDILPVTEESRVMPRSPYAVSKLSAEALCTQWCHSENFDIVIARPFNHVGPGQKENFALSNFASQILNNREFIEVGDLSITRDFTDVRDIVRAYLLLLEKGMRGEIYNICSGIERSLGEIIEEMMHIKKVSIPLYVNKDKIRLNEQKRMKGCFEKLKKDTNWTPNISFSQTLEDILRR